MTGWPPSKRRVTRGDPAVARAVQGLDQIDVVGGDGVVEGDAQVLAHGVVEGGHRPRRAEVAVHGLVGSVLGGVGDRVAVAAGLDALHPRARGHGLAGGRRPGAGKSEVRASRGSGTSGFSPAISVYPKLSPHRAELLGLACGWCRSPPGRPPSARARCSPDGLVGERRRVQAPWPARRAGRRRPRPPARCRRRRPARGGRRPRRAGWDGRRARGTPPPAAGTARRAGRPSSVSSISGYLTGGASAVTAGLPKPTGAPRARAGGGSSCLPQCTWGRGVS